MTDAIIVALITGACAIVAQLIISRQSAKDLYAKLDKQSELSDKELESKLEKWKAVIEVKIDNLGKSVEKHNSFGQRIPVIEEKISVANHRIDDLERKVG